jgi:quinol monooxygenase YgiN
MIIINISSADADTLAAMRVLQEARKCTGLLANSPLHLYKSVSEGSFWIADPAPDMQQKSLAAVYRQALLNEPSLGPAHTATIQELEPRNVKATDAPEGSTAVFAVLNPATGLRDTTLDLLAKMMGHTRGEPGNFYYNLYESGEDGSLWMFEAYRNDAALQAHRASSYYQTYVPQIAQQLSGPIRVHTAINADPT